MKGLKHHIALILISMTIWSCREVYYPDDLESNEKIPVIQGKIMANEPAQVQLYWAIEKDSSIRHISDAEVSITDDLGNVESLFAGWQGYYHGYGVIGVPGHTYTLRVKLADGREYESIPQLLQNAPEIDSIYAKPGRRTSYVYSGSGTPVTNEEEGLYINSDFSSYYDKTLYYRFHTIVVKEMVYSVELNTPSSHSIYLWETTTMDNTYTVDFSVNKDNMQVLYKHPVGYLRYYYDATLQTETRTAPYTLAWIITQQIYSISPDVYQFYNSVGRQLSGVDQIFAPVASQVKSNIYCTSHLTEKVIGVFEASSLTTVYRAFSWKNLVYHRSRDLPYFPEVGDGSSERFPPDFWISFF